LKRWRLLLTRPAEECAQVAQQLAEHGIASVSLPLLSIVPLPVEPRWGPSLATLDQYAAVIVVSKPAARLALQRLMPGWRQPADQAWFSVGAATAAIVQAHGVRVAFPDGGDDSEALLGMPALQSVLARASCRVLILRGEGGRELLGDTLRARGAQVDYLELYRRELPEYAAGELFSRLVAERLNGVVVSSGQGLQHLLLLAARDKVDLAETPVFVPSARVAEQAEAAGLSTVVDCRGASTAALLTALRQQAASRFRS